MHPPEHEPARFPAFSVEPAWKTRIIQTFPKATGGFLLLGPRS